MFAVVFAGAAHCAGKGIFTNSALVAHEFYRNRITFSGMEDVYGFFGTMDKWVYLFVLLAVAALVFRRPFAFTVFLIMSLLVHRGGIFYVGILALFVWHAVWRLPAFRQRRKTWIVASIMPLIAFFVLWALHNPDRAFLVYEQSKIAYLYDINRPGGPLIISVSGGNIHDMLFIIENWLILPRGAILGFLFYAGPAIAATAFFAGRAPVPA